MVKKQEATVPLAPLEATPLASPTGPLSGPRVSLRDPRLAALLEQMSDVDVARMLSSVVASVRLPSGATREMTLLAAVEARGSVIQVIGKSLDIAA